MATYNATVFDGSNSLGTTVDKSQPATDLGNGATTTIAFQFATAGFATADKPLTGDVLQLVKIPKGALIYPGGWGLFIPDMESSTGALTIDFGLLTQDPNAFLELSQIGRAGGYVTSFTQSSIANASVASPSTQGVSIASLLSVTCASGAALTAGYDILALTFATGSTAAGTTETIEGWITYNLRGGLF